MRQTPRLVVSRITVEFQCQLTKGINSQEKGSLGAEKSTTTRSRSESKNKEVDFQGWAQKEFEEAASSTKEPACVTEGQTCQHYISMVTRSLLCLRNMFSTNFVRLKPVKWRSGASPTFSSDKLLELQGVMIAE